MTWYIHTSPKDHHHSSSQHHRHIIRHHFFFFVVGTFMIYSPSNLFIFLTVSFARQFSILIVSNRQNMSIFSFYVLSKKASSYKDPLSCFLTKLCDSRVYVYVYSPSWISFFVYGGRWELRSCQSMWVSSYASTVGLLWCLAQKSVDLITSVGCECVCAYNVLLLPNSCTKRLSLSSTCAVPTWTILQLFSLHAERKLLWPLVIAEARPLSPELGN